LLLERPEFWQDGLSGWAAAYEPRLQTFLRILEDRGKIGLESGILNPADILSTRMRQSWESGDFWINYALQRSWAFDSIYWKWIDHRFWGEASIDRRLKLLTAEAREEMNDFVQDKLEKSKTRILDDWRDTASQENV
ncbi:C6 transcription factor, partial [Xylogone sp. PMI_703]